jgi:mannose-6-phosphate isomerase
MGPRQCDESLTQTLIIIDFFLATNHPYFDTRSILKNTIFEVPGISQQLQLQLHPRPPIYFTMQAPLLRLQCGVNSYDWGKKGNDSCAARYAAATAPPAFSIKPDQPYAEVREYNVAAFMNSRLIPV